MNLDALLAESAVMMPVVRRIFCPGRPAGRIRPGLGPDRTCGPPRHLL